jgi:hypothetical protein
MLEPIATDRSKRTHHIDYDLLITSTVTYRESFPLSKTDVQMIEFGHSANWLTFVDCLLAAFKDGSLKNRFAFWIVDQRVPTKQGSILKWKRLQSFRVLESFQICLGDWKLKMGDWRWKIANNQQPTTNIEHRTSNIELGSSPGSSLEGSSLATNNGSRIRRFNVVRGQLHPQCRP